MKTEQLSVWTGEFGKQYTERNRFANSTEFNAIYKNRYGRTRDDINLEWCGSLPRDIRILEVGANIGYQLQSFQRLGFQNLFGIEIQRYCIEDAKRLTKGIDIVEASAFDIPFKDQCFDLVFTNNVLIHIAPNDLPMALREIVRVSRKYILGFEYFADQFTEINYHGKDNLLWKANYCALYQEECTTLQVVREQLFPCLDEPGNEDNLFLLMK
jgi:pseudaminic acid biosynthesis-associated methylase